MAPSQTLYLAGVVVAAGLTAVLLGLQRPPVTQRTVLAAIPWMLVGALLHVLGSAATYPPVVAPLVDAPQVFVVALVAGGLVWVLLVQFATLRMRRENSADYLAASGMSALLVLALALVVVAPVDQQGLVWAILTPIVAAVVAGIGYFLLGLVDASPLAYTGLVGLLTVFGHTLDGLAVAVAVDVFGQPARSALSRAAVDLAAGLPVADLSVGWVFVLAKLAGALVVVWLLTAFVSRTRAWGYVALAYVMALGFIPGIATLLALAVG